MPLLLRNRCGGTVIEYALLATIFAITSIAAWRAVSDNAVTRFEEIATAVDEATK